MEHLPPLVRSKAIEIANALLEEGYEEGMAIRIAIAKAKEWAERRGLLSFPSLLRAQRERILSSVMEVPSSQHGRKGKPSQLFSRDLHLTVR